MLRRSDAEFYQPAPAEVVDRLTIISPDGETEVVEIPHEVNPSKRTVKAASAGKTEKAQKRYEALRALFKKLRSQRQYLGDSDATLYEIVARRIVGETEDLFTQKPSVRTVRRATRSP